MAEEVAESPNRNRCYQSMGIIYQWRELVAVDTAECRKGWNPVPFDPDSPRSILANMGKQTRKQSSRTAMFAGVCQNFSGHAHSGHTPTAFICIRKTWRRKCE
ncbi:uncharacterized protein LOC113563763 [Drosophila erecta]|uniref:uncharacterized protein LOC113563763 n=1 Tax=Drosophila erecta TaxID=7220 RepID=UPI000F071B0D|nr:uncharacterized protein LOC113563763 [Drosophila erecta]